MRLLKKMVTIISVIFSWLIYSLSFLFPRDNATWIFIGWHQNEDRDIFADNCKYLYLYVTAHEKDIDAVWIGGSEKLCTLLRTRGLKAYRVNSLKGAFYSFRARYTFCSAHIQTTNWKYCGGTKIMQLWHGDGIKNMRFMKNERWSLVKFFKYIFSPGLFVDPDFLISSSDFTAKHFICPSFNVEKKKVLISGLPRYDVLLDNTTRGSDIDVYQELSHLLDKLRSHDPKRIILYAPTFRRGEENDLLLKNLQMEQLDQILKKKNEYMVASLHPKFSKTYNNMESPYTNIFFANSDFDKYPLLPRFDLLITDYSSLCIEFIFMQKPVIFFTYDFESYLKDPGMYKAMWDVLPNNKVSTFEGLVALLDKDDKALNTDTDKSRDILFTYKDAHSSQRIVKYIKKLTTA